LLDRLQKIRASRAPAKPANIVAKPWLRHYDAQTTEGDVIACFRLLLGRNPNPEEWTGHMMHVGEPLDQVVTSYLTSLEFSRRGLTNEMPADYVIADLPDFRIFSDINDNAVGKFVRENIYEHDVTTVFRKLLRPGMSVLDIGANIGYYAMLSASIVGPTGHVFAVEPNHQNVKLLEASRRLNMFGHMTVVPFAAAASAGVMVLTTSFSTGTTSAPPEEITALLNARIVPCAALDSIVPEEQHVDLIKIDVDGAEYHAMLGCEKIITRCRPAIISEFAPALLPGISGIGGEDYLRWFGRHNYNVSVIEPDGSILAMGQRWHEVMAAYAQRGVDHIDILALPIAKI
jgi:FkbM family methyltransferase